MTDLKLFEPQRLTDNPNGGGLATQIEIIDGQIYNLFPAIDRIDRVNGETVFRKFFLKASLPTNKLFNAVHMIVAMPPADPNVSLMLFQTAGWADERRDAQSLVERYLDESVITRFIPYDRQQAGQRTIAGFQRPEAALPEIGQAYVLKNESLTPETSEFIRVQDIRHEVQNFTDDSGTYTARVIMLTITQPLKTQFLGSQPNRFFTVAAGRSVLRSTIVSDAARFAGITPLAVDAASGAVRIKVESVFAQLAPASASERAIVNATPGGVSAPIASALVPIVTTYGVSGGINETVYTARAIVPGSLSITHAEGSLLDDGKGVLQVSGGTLFAVDGTVNYEQGRIDFRSVGGGRSVSIAYTPAAFVATSAHTAQQAVTQSSRGFVYIQQCRPTPAPGTLTVAFFALGRWNEMQDDGSGALVGAPGIGTGSISFDTGIAVVTLGTLPDIGSSVIWSWAGSSEYEIRTGDTEVLPPQIEHTLSAGNCEPDTLSISWTSGGIARTASDNGAGLITGDATGRIVYANGRSAFRPTLLPDPSTTFVFEYESAAVETEIFNPSKSGSTVTITATETPVRPRSILITYPQSYTTGPLSVTTAQQLTDNGAGELIDAAGNVKAGSAVNYATGEITWPPDFTAITPVLNYERFQQQLPARTTDPTTGYFAAIAQFGRFPISCGNAATNIGFQDGSSVTLQYKQDIATDAAQTDTIPAPPLVIDLTPTTIGRIVPGGVMFGVGGRVYVDRAGTLQHSISSVNGAGSTGGTIDYGSGRATITSWIGGASSTLTRIALLTEVAQLPVGYVTGRVNGAPLRPSSFVVRALRYDTGAQITAVSAVNGEISTAQMHGYIDINTGVFSLRFGGYVADAALTDEEKAELWYSPLDVVDGFIFKPTDIIPGSLAFDAAIVISLPLDPSIIGINPVRLPLDGRVQIIRNGSTIVIHNRQTDALGDAMEAGDTIMLTRAGISSVTIYDNDRKQLDRALYSVDKSAGSITFADPLDLSDYTLPLFATHTVENIRLASGVQVTGDIDINTPLTASFAAGDTYVSTALLLGNQQARYDTLFALNTWLGDWNATSGTGPTSGAQYDDVNFPILVNNRDAITERWRLAFTSSTTFNIVGEKLGVIGTGNTTTGAAPINPGTGEPYVVIPGGGFGAGWGINNNLRLDTIAAGEPVWGVRTVKPGEPVALDDSATVERRYDEAEAA